MNGKKSPKTRREYQIIRKASAIQLAEMDAEGWKREHMQFRDNGDLDVVFSRVVRDEKPAEPIKTVVVPAIGAEIPHTFSTVGANVNDIRKGLMDKRFGDLFDTQKLIDVSNRKIANAIITTANEFYNETMATQDTSPLGEVA